LAHFLAKGLRGVAFASQALTRVHHEPRYSLRSAQSGSVQHAATMNDYGLAARRQLVEHSGLRAEGACLVAGCPCKDPRIVSHRRAAFFAAVAREHHETADRAVAADPDWRIPALAA
jgi:hypothetical protein